ncbi:TPA: methyltransferase [Legionella feeleii]|uniref:O-methyltransferase n=1 Tax=Legionella feeleii TaxID=453 RepID=A0A0W0U9B2_9GAMM|nr:methyltransferase [Legionella feeleii]KTD04369.1 O-methyltransferase [Legionella feeleii]SPX62835.1 O-methyltransferase [Legionella feeleii]
MHSSNQEQPHIQLAIMSRWYVVSRAIHAVAKLGIANHMSLKPININELAERTGTVPELLNRLLKFLSAYGLFNCDGNSYSLTSLSMPLRDDDPHSVRDVLCMVDDSWWQSFAHLDTSLKTGNSAFSHQHSDSFFSFLSKHPEKQANFDRGMARLSTFDDEAIATAYDFSKFSHLVDMGGGRGGLTRALARHYPKLQLTLLDTAAVIEQLRNTDFPPQIKLTAGDFLAQIPPADAYIFKGVLHDFNDNFMHEILANCHQQMTKSTSLFIAEQVMPDSPAPHPNKTMDIVMMVLLGGRQRTLSEWQQSIEPSGFVFQDSYKTDTLFTLMAFKPN